MVIDFIVERSGNVLIVKDNTIPSKVSKTENINTLILKVSSDKISQVKTFDCVAYITRNLKDKELMKLVPADFDTTSFKDGLYTFSLCTNGKTPIEHSYIFYHNILAKYQEVSTKLGYEVNINKYDYIQYINEESASKIEEMRLVGSLIDQLKLQSYNKYDKNTINDLLYKANRLLEIIEN